MSRNTVRTVFQVYCLLNRCTLLSTSYEMYCSTLTKNGRTLSTYGSILAAYGSILTTYGLS